MATEQLVRHALLTLLPTVDLDVETERTICAKLEQKLGDISAFETLIEDELNKFLENCEDPEDDIQTQQEARACAESISQAKRPAQAPKVESSPKRAKLDAAASGNFTAPNSGGPGGASADGEYILQLSKTRRVSVETYQGKKLVSIREFYEDQAGELKPTRKGLSVTESQWGELKNGVEVVDAAIEQGGQKGFLVSLSATRKVTISEYGGKLMVDLREYYGKGDDLKPGKKGITLPPAQWEILKANMQAIDGELGAPTRGGCDQVQAKVDNSSSTGAGTTTGKGPSGSGAGCRMVELSDTRRASVENFKGKILVSVREYYQDKASGEMKPGFKGLSMNTDQWKVLHDNADTINEAVQTGGQQGIVAKLSTTRFVDVHQFKSMTMVSLREYYEDKNSGEMKPGKKGINLTVDQWAKLYPNIGALSEAVQNM
ncbi:hypothetical protein CYMTET_23303 [Cymbomonas tetramitiformis]|uniref:Transcriptional coactivator p15 (PC4) C-terminal domain-containing protein n=1 Tax=Cymbomonas tetramitiformis TaxID=36881 RepID=A0AAE0FYK3_9CHLO|nr:hypothetical protein CYMTET_23303 [Cymbomonas tetramitiformis]